MTFKEALDTGYRITEENYINRWFIKKNNNSIMGEDNYVYKDVTPELIIGTDWIIHPEDQKLIDFNNKLDKIIEE